ncbi:MAG: hypothetical protein KDA32_03675 [Phycisphaerales bacterium]|nr:hypothetical protein [Phycisphaerales bacterium]
MARQIAFLTLVLAVFVAGCADRAAVSASDPELAEFIELMIPKRIEIRPHMTKAVNVDEAGGADQIEVVIAAYDSYDDPVKAVGVFQFELYTFRPASGDRLGQRLAYWETPLTRESQLEYWDRVARFYSFPLDGKGLDIKPGRYILVASLRGPSDDRLTSEYEFDYAHEAPTSK